MAVKIRYHPIDSNPKNLTAETPANFCLEVLRDRKKPFSVHKGFKPSCENEITRNLEQMVSINGNFTIIETPGGIFDFVGDALSFVGDIVGGIVSFLIDPFIPDIPQPAALKNVNRQQESPNNSLTNRSNIARVNERIPDIGGEVNSIPDIIMNPYRKFSSNIEEEVSYYCVGRKSL